MWSGSGGRRSLLAATAAVVLLAAYSAPSGGQVEATYDRFDASTTVVARIFPDESFGPVMCGKPGLVLTAAVPDDRSTPAGPAALVLVARCDNWTYLRCHTVRALVDGKPFELPASSHNGSVRSGGVSEFVTVPLSMAQVSRLVESQSLDLQLCRSEISLESRGMETLREFGELVRRLSSGEVDGEIVSAPPESEAICSREIRERMVARGLSAEQIASACDP